MAIQTEPRLYTVEEYFEIAQSPEYENQRLELINGELVVMAASSSENSETAMLIGYFLTGFAREHKLGRVTGADGGYQLGPDTALMPDAAFVSIERAPKWTGNVFDGAPDLAVEVISPSETKTNVVDKVWAYLRAGAKLVWAVYPKQKVVDVYRFVSEDRVDLQRIGVDGVLDGADVLPGFTLAVKDVFPE